MMQRVTRRTGFTLLELMIAIVVIGVILAVATPSIKRYLESQRLRSVSGEMMVDLQFARTEAVARGRVVGIRLDRNADQTCYTLAAYSGANCIVPGFPPMATCDCRLGVGSACTGNWTELKTVSVPNSTAVRVDYIGITQAVGFDPTSGQLAYCNPNMVGGTPPAFRANITGATTAGMQLEIAPAGRPRLCVTSGKVSGVQSC